MHGSKEITSPGSGIPEELAYSVRSAARLLDLSERKLWDLVKSGEIQSFQVGVARRISRVALLDFIKQAEAA